jgi:hypothetical protein
MPNLPSMSAGMSADMLALIQMVQTQHAVGLQQAADAQIARDVWWAQKCAADLQQDAIALLQMMP